MAGGLRSLINVGLFPLSAPAAAPSTAPQTGLLTLVAHPYTDTQASTVAAPPFPFGVIDFDNSFSFDVIGGETDVYLSTDTYISHASDTPSEEYFAPRLLVPFSYQVRAFSGLRPAGATQAGFGEVVIQNEGDLDSLTGYGWDGRDIQLWRGAKTDAFADFNLVFRGTCDGIDWNERQIVVRLRDRQFIFDRPISQGTYGGTGQYDGSADIAGKNKPMAFGEIPNVPLVLIDPTNQVYQAHFRAMESFDEVRDKGVALTGDGDVTDLYDTTVSAGHYKTDLTRGCIRLGAQPDGLITADIKGDNVGGYVNTTGRIMRRIATQFLGGDSFDDPTGLYSPSFIQMEIDQPAEIGYWIGPDGVVNVRQVFDDLMAGVGGLYGVRIDGKFSISILKDPADLTADYVLTPRNSSGLQPISRVGGLATYLERVAYDRLAVTQSPDQLAGSVSASDVSRFKEEARFAQHETSGVRVKHRNAQAVVTASFFRDEADAQTEAERLGALHSVDRSVYSVRATEIDLFAVDLGKVVELSGWNRWDLGSSKNFIIKGIQADAKRNELLLELWG